MIFKQQHGFSLLESLIALVVLSVGILGLVRLQVFIDKKADYALTSLEALSLAELKLEHYRTRSTNSAATSTLWFDGTELADNGSGVTENDLAVSGSSYTFARQTVINDAIMLPPPSVSAAAKTITVSVGWQDRWGEVHSIDLNTMLSRYSEFD
ncbi:type IV pilus modification PilV family protein [Thaumasiovibrio sp. DFM-14]|uniref:type IV pilus modification PilV family protein n=1 Tax=Thaumasiovibrio sp. DFM-14 TaxID=3384792 RepID=UPI00399FAE91